MMKARTELDEKTPLSAVESKKVDHRIHDSEATHSSDSDHSGRISKKGTKRKAREEDDEEVAQKLESRRAYNRACAAKARRRTKELVASLQEQVDSLSKDKAKLEQSIEVKRAQIQFMERQNNQLINQRAIQQAALAPFVQSQQDAILGSGGGSLPASLTLEMLQSQFRR